MSLPDDAFATKSLRYPAVLSRSPRPPLRENLPTDGGRTPQRYYARPHAFLHGSATEIQIVKPGNEHRQHTLTRPRSDGAVQECNNNLIAEPDHDTP